MGIRVIPRLATERASVQLRLRPRILVSLAVLAAGTFVADSLATESALEPEALQHARVIRAEVGARYRLLPGRKLTVTEATTTGVFDSLTLLTDLLELPRVVPANNGIYFAICTRRAKCPYPVRSAAWPATAFLPRRQALELALRTFLETSASLVVVALPTVQPVWSVFERDDLFATIDAPALLAQLAPSPALIDTPLRDAVDRVTRTRLFVPLPTFPPSRATILAVRLALMADTTETARRPPRGKSKSAQPGASRLAVHRSGEVHVACT